MMTIKKIAMQLCLSSAVIAAMPATFAAETAQICAKTRNFCMLIHLKMQK